jgi:hypothetical protein
LWFSVRAKHRKMLSAKNIFQKNDFPETILWRKPFYVETNGALLGFYFLEKNHKHLIKLKVCSRKFKMNKNVLSWESAVIMGENLKILALRIFVTSTV